MIFSSMTIFPLKVYRVVQKKYY